MLSQNVQLTDSRTADHTRTLSLCERWLDAVTTSIYHSYALLAQMEQVYRMEWLAGEKV
jgi:hypothetical protein